MKTAIVAILLAASLSGCMTHDLPKNAYMRDVTSTLRTPWGSHELKIGEAGTGTAATKAAGMKP